MRDLVIILLILLGTLIYFWPDIIAFLQETLVINPI